MAGKPLTPEMAKHFNMEAGQIIDLESTMHELSTEVGISIKGINPPYFRFLKNDELEQLHAITTIQRYS